MKGVKFSSVWTILVLILEATVCITRNHNLFVTANATRVLRGSPSNSIRLGDERRELPEAGARKKENKKGDKTDKADKNNKKDRDGVAKIEASPPKNSDAEDSGRDDIESPNVASESLENSKNIPIDETPKELESSQPSATSDSSPSFHSDNVFESTSTSKTEDPVPSPNLEDAEIPEPIIDLPNNKGTDVVFDKTKFVTVTRMEPIVFDVTVSKFTAIVDNEELNAYFKNFVEDVLDMRSNGNWYPSHAKSMHDLSITLLPSSVSNTDFVERSVDDGMQVQLLLNGYVAVHTKNESDEVATATTRNAGGPKQKVAVDTASTSTFHESFDHSMLLYFTFWGVENIEEILKKQGGLQNPVITSVSVGEKKLMTFGIDKDDNYLYGGNHDSAKPPHSKEEVMSRFGDISSGRASKHGLLTFLLIAAVNLII